jgi:hypothetical protein
MRHTPGLDEGDDSRPDERVQVDSTRDLRTDGPVDQTLVGGQRRRAILGSRVRQRRTGSPDGQKDGERRMFSANELFHGGYDMGGSERSLLGFRCRGERRSGWTKILIP